MKSPHYLMTGLFLGLTALVTLDSALASAGWAPAFSGLKWMRVHFITLGVLTQLLFGLLPALTARDLRLPQPPTNWFSWLTYNAGLVILLIGLPPINAPMIIAGGTLIFIAVLALMKDLLALRRSASASSEQGGVTVWFHLTGLFYLLIGVLVGTGMWIGWSEPLRIAIPKEVHVHTNLWGYTAVVFAGLIFNLFPALAREKLFGNLPLDLLVLASLGIGASGLVVGPWLNIGWPAVAGLILHTLGILLLLARLVRLVVRTPSLRSAGPAHLVTSFLWLLVPVVVAPYIVAKASDSFPVAEVAGSGGPILIYGWILTFLLALIPYTYRMVVDDRSSLALVGSWVRLAFMHIGGVLFWLALFLPEVQVVLRSAAFLFWLAALLPVLLDLFSLVKTASEPTSTQENRVARNEPGIEETL